MFRPVDVLEPQFISRGPKEIWPQISPLYSVDEDAYVAQLLPMATPGRTQLEETTKLAKHLIEQVRGHDDGIHKIDALLLEYSLDTKEGVLLMCLAEALLRVPDAETADALIEDKMGGADWATHLGRSESFFANVSTWGLMLTGKVVTLDNETPDEPAGMIAKMIDRVSEPVIREAMKQAMKIMGKHFVLGRNIGEALKRSRPYRDKGASFSFDMLGEAALTAEDASKYFGDYERAIKAIGKDRYAGRSNRPTSISIKLSALHPRYETAQKERVMTELFSNVLSLAKTARDLGVGINIDAEEADRLELSLELFEKLYTHPYITGWGEFGVVVQAYSKRALPALAWLAALAKHQGDCIPVRLVKGAYWDAEIKESQQGGYEGYPVYTRKETTDMAYLACAKFMLSEHLRGVIFPQFATHNAHTVASVRAMATHSDYEFQRLNGMGDALYDVVLREFDVNVCVYAPVGSHKDLLAYLVRRLLENGANSSFVHRLIDDKCPAEDLTQHPVETLKSRDEYRNPYIVKPLDIFPKRENSRGVNLNIASEYEPLEKAVRAFDDVRWTAGDTSRPGRPIHAPFDRNEIIGTLHAASEAQVKAALDSISGGFKSWSDTAVGERAACLGNLANLLEDNMPELIALCQREAGKTWQDSIDEVREAVDFCRYYAVQAPGDESGPKPTAAPVADAAPSVPARQRHKAGLQSLAHTGRGSHPVTPTTLWAVPETGAARAKGAPLTKARARGVFVCISPWNFPLAIFLGQVAAALVTGNTVIAKPAEQTSLIAQVAADLIYKSGVPKDAFIMLPGGGDVGGMLTSDPRVVGVAFTGSNPTAQRINRSLAARDCDPAVLIAETGGQNAMIIDSTSLPEQVVRDVVRSAFASAGQRCSALRVLYVQDDIAKRVVPLIKGAIKELSIGHPALLSTDVGPVIDEIAAARLQDHIDDMNKNAKLIGKLDVPGSCKNGTYIAPHVFEISSIDVLKEEHFGPILHVVRYKAKDLQKIIDAINATQFGLTLGVQSRNDRTCQRIADGVRAGNIYVNRDQVGAVVGVQPFGGQGLSGTGPKAGGPHYLTRFQTRKPINAEVGS